MSYPIRKLIAGRSAKTIREHETVQDALTIMVDNDYSQLPIVGERGQLLGVISEPTVVRRYHMAPSVSLFELDVTHCMTKAVTMAPEDEIFDAIGRLQEVPAVIIVEDEKPIGIITYFDTTHYFRDVSEGLMYVEDIETRLRNLIQGVFPTEKELTAALFKAFGTNRRNEEEPGKQFDELSFGDHIQLIVTNDVWPDFNDYLQPKQLFHVFMNRVRGIRNQIAHFREDIDEMQKSFLIEAREWLFSRPFPELSGETDSLISDDAADSDVDQNALATIDLSSGKYTPITNWLLEQPKSKNRVQYTLDDLDNLLADSLPDSARNHSAWWANNPAGHVQARSWLQAGWLVENIDLQLGVVHFRRTRQALYILFHDDVVERISKRRPTLVTNRVPRPQHWLSLPTDVPSFSLGWAFLSNDRLKIGLDIATGDAGRNAALFDKLHERKASIESKVGIELHWERETSRGTATVEHFETGRVDAPKNRLDELKEITANLTIKMMDAVIPVIRDAEA